MPQLPNGKKNDGKTLVLNCISAATDVVSMVVDIKDMGDTACMINIISDVIEEFPAIGDDPTTLDIIQIAGSASKDITLGLAKCVVKDASKHLLKFVGKVIKEAGKKVGDIASGYQWLQMAGSVGKITERAVKLYEYATPLESIFIVVGSPWQYDTYPPSIPTGVNAVAASTTQINLSWSASTDDVGVAGYNIYRDETFLKAVTNTSASDTGLSPDTQYCYTVSAYDAAGNESGQSDEVCATATLTLSYVILKSATPQTNNMQFDYDGAVYDTYYTDPPHWKIVDFDGYMQFSFNGKNDFTFHALGSTSGGISYCHVKVYVNGNVYWSDKFIDKNWTDYTIPSSSFTTGSNTVKIVLTGNTHFWIDEASIEASISSPGACWIKDANAYDSNNNGIVADPTSSANKVFRLYGSVGGCWGALAYREFSFPSAFSVNVKIYNGSEDLSGCHPSRGSIAMRYGTSWQNSGSGLVNFLENGDIVARNGSIIGHFPLEQWLNIAVHYQRVNNDLTLHYWVNGEDLGEINMTITDLSKELSFDHFELAVNEGTAYFDDVIVSSDLSPTTLEENFESYDLNTWPCIPGSGGSGN